MKRWLLAAMLVPALCHCTTDDTGKACSDPNTSFGTTPSINNENATVEVVSLGRDPNCQSFQCLEHRGLAPYCTRQCSYDPTPSGAPSCNTDTDCTAPLHCNAGKCSTDNCPKGFACHAIQDTGEFAGQLYCVRRSCLPSNNSFDCENLGSIACISLGCYGSCPADSNCTYNQLTCEPETQFCTCAPNGAQPPCSSDALLQCQLPPLNQTLPAGAVTTENVCLPKG